MAEKLTDEELDQHFAHLHESPFVGGQAIRNHLDALNAEIADLQKEDTKTLLKLTEANKTIRIYGAVAEGDDWWLLPERPALNVSNDRVCRYCDQVFDFSDNHPDANQHANGCPVPAALKRKAEIDEK